METHKILDTNVLIEGRTGLTTIFNVIEYPKSLDKRNEIVWPDRSDFELAIEIMVDLLKAGKQIPVINVLVAAMCVKSQTHFGYQESSL